MNVFLFTNKISKFCLKILLIHLLKMFELKISCLYRGEVYIHVLFRTDKISTDGSQSIVFACCVCVTPLWGIFYTLCRNIFNLCRYKNIRGTGITLRGHWRGQIKRIIERKINTLYICIYSYRCSNFKVKRSDFHTPCIVSASAE